MLELRVVAQRVAGFLLPAERQKRTGRLNEIAGPYEMVSAALVAGVPPMER
jgi:hypothetical protein